MQQTSVSLEAGHNDPADGVLNTYRSPGFHRQCTKQEFPMTVMLVFNRHKMRKIVESRPNINHTK